MVNRRSELLEECLVVPIRGLLLHNDRCLVVGDFVNHEGWLLRSFFINKVLERGDTFIWDIDTADCETDDRPSMPRACQWFTTYPDGS